MKKINSDYDEEFYRNRKQNLKPKSPKNNCPQCANIVESKKIKLIERNINPMVPLEKIRTFNAKRRIWKHRDSFDEWQEEIEKDKAETLKKEELEKEKKQKEKEKLDKKHAEYAHKTRAKAKVHRKARKPQKPFDPNGRRRDGSLKHPLVFKKRDKPMGPIEDTREPAPEAKPEEIKNYEIPNIPKKAETYRNRVLHALFVQEKDCDDDKEYLRARHKTKFAHKHFHLYDTTSQMRNEEKELLRSNTNPKFREDVALALQNSKKISKKHDALEEKDKKFEYDKYLKYLD